MDKFKMVMSGIGGVVMLVVIAFTLGIGGLEWKKFFGVKHRDVDRQIFEQSQPYVHGKLQELAKYYGEYRTGSQDDKDALSAIIKMQFSSFDKNTIKVPELKTFLVNVRGY